MKKEKKKEFLAKRPTSTPSTEGKIPSVNEISTKKSTSTDLQFNI
jgi:hypothetical protein